MDDAGREMSIAEKRAGSDPCVHNFPNTSLYVRQRMRWDKTLRVLSCAMLAAQYSCCLAVDFDHRGASRRRRSVALTSGHNGRQLDRRGQLLAPHEIGRAHV